MDFLNTLAEDGLTWPEAVLALGLLGFAAVCIIAFVALLIGLLGG